MTHGVVTPNIEAAISGRLSPSSSGAACTIPAIAAAALARMRAETELMPATSTTEAASIMSLAPTIGRVSPAAIVETISFGHADRQRPHGLGGDRGVARAAGRQHAVAAPLGVRRSTTAVAPRAIVSTAWPAIAGGAQGLDVGAGRGRDLLAARRARPAGRP